MFLISALGCRGKITNNVTVNDSLFIVKNLDTISLNAYYIFYMYNDKYKSVKVFSERKQPLPCETPIVIGGSYELKLDTQDTYKYDTSLKDGGIFRLRYSGLKVISDTTVLLSIDLNEVVYSTKNIYNNCYKK